MTRRLRRIVVVGAGALGSHAVQFLRSVPDATVKVIDCDRVEAKNTQAQLHAVGALRKNKAEALKQLVAFVWNVKLEAVPHRLTKDNVEQLLGGADLVIDCLDNGVSRRIVQDWARRRSVACLHGGLATGGDFGRVIWDEDFVIDDEDSAGEATCEGGELLPFIGIVSAFIARSAQLYLQDARKVGWQVHPGGAVRV